MNRRLLVVVLLFVLHTPEDLLSQEVMVRKPFGFSAGMGATYVNAFDVVDYINQFAATSGRVGDFGTAVEFFAAPELSFDSGFGIKLEYAYLLKQYTIAGPLPGNFEFSYHTHMPTAALFYRLEGNAFYVKFGGGLGYHVGKFTRRDPNSGTEGRYSSGGIGFKLELMGNTAFGESLYGLIGGDLRLDFIGKLKDDAGRALEVRRLDGSMDPVRLRFASAGIKFGLIYFF